VQPQSDPSKTSAKIARNVAKDAKKNLQQSLRSLRHSSRSLQSKAFGLNDENRPAEKALRTGGAPMSCVLQRYCTTSWKVAGAVAVPEVPVIVMV
jgi:hypothetical protein